MVTLEQIKSNIQDVTSEQIGKCHKIIDRQTGKDFYLVDNEAGDFNEEGELIEYKVQHSSEHGFTCTCMAGMAGFSQVTVHPSGVCKHVRWAVAAFLEEEAAMQEICTKIEAEPIVRKMSTVEAQMPAWIMNSKPARHMRRAPKELR